MATILQEKIFKNRMEAKRKNKSVTMKDIVLQSGGSISTAQRPKIITDSKGWQELKAKYLDDEKALKTLQDLADHTNEDKDNRFKASVEILKLNDRYPATKNKIVGLFDKISNLEDISI